MVEQIVDLCSSVNSKYTMFWKNKFVRCDTRNSLCYKQYIYIFIVIHDAEMEYFRCSYEETCDKLRS